MTLGWHFACSESGYTNSSINLYWIKHVVDPASRARAKGKPRKLMSDGFAPHESVKVMMTFCFENDIVLCRLPSHASHKLQSCDVGCFERTASSKARCPISLLIVRFVLQPAILD